MKTIIACAIVLLSMTSHAQQPAYKNPLLPINERVDDLLNRMSVEEQAAQLYSYASKDTVAFDADGTFIGTQDTAAISHGVGSINIRGLRRGHSAKEAARCLNGIQRFMLERSRFGIPVFSFNESLHGLMAEGATSFPQAIALGSTWDTALVERVFTAAALEASARGTRQVLSPVLDLARDPRWGRTEECYGEDPYHVSRIAMAAVFGLQGRAQTIDKGHIAVTLKHFAGHGQSEGGRNIAPVNFSDREFRENHLYPFEMAVTHAHARSIMVSYNEWDGVPNHVNHKLLTDILRDDWGFDGYVMSDGGGIDVTVNDHHAAASLADAGALSLSAGVDYELGSGQAFGALTRELAAGKVSKADIRRAAGNVLRVKMECGLFEDPYADTDEMERVTNSPGHKALALTAAHEAMVLLKNEKRTLPFDAAKMKTVAVIGPNAAGVHLGGYSAWPMQGVSVLEGIREYARGKFTVLYAEGCKLTVNKECHWQVNENPVLNDPKSDRRLIAEAVKAARRSDAVILALGENELICREAWSESHLGDRDNLDLVGMQNDLVDAIMKTGKPVVALLINGRPITMNNVAKKVPAIIECWYLGQETGRAVADVLFGRVNPSGKLTVTFPRSVGQLPCYYDHKPTRHREYVLADNSVLYPFGFGLSYASFEYAHLIIAPKTISPRDAADISVDVTNTGAVAGDEIVQLYLHDIISLPTRPVKELKDFSRISLAPGETRRVTFHLTPDKLAAFGMDMKRTVEPGAFEVMVGTNSVDVIRDTLTVH